MQTKEDASGFALVMKEKQVQNDGPMCTFSWCSGRE